MARRGHGRRSTPDTVTPDGSTIRLRFTRFNVTRDRFESKMELSPEGGRTWAPGTSGRPQPPVFSRLVARAKQILAIFRIIEYTYALNSPLRTFKAQVFQALAHPTRIAVVEALRDGELSAGALVAHLGVEQANLSQHLAVLRAKQIVVSRKAGNQAYYALRDPVLLRVLDLLKQYFNAHLNETVAMLGEMGGDHDGPV